METAGERYNPAMKITDQAEANEYFERLVQNAMTRQGIDREAAERQERGNLGYYAGYHSAETRERVERLFGCQHPVFGSIRTNGTFTPKMAEIAGRKEAIKTLRYEE